MLKTLCVALFIASTTTPVQGPLDDALAEARRHSERVDQVLIDNRDLRNFNLWGALIFSIIRQEPWVTLRVIEDKLRRLRIDDVYLLARPIEQTGFCARLPVDPPDRCRRYSVWIEVNGPEKARERLQSFGADEAQNLERLQDAGFLTTTRELRL